MLKFIGVLAALFIFIFLPGYAIIHGIHFETGRGEHTGYITAVERTGLIWKTGTAYIKSDVSSSQEDLYCVNDPAVYSQLEDLAKNREKVTIQYKDYLVKGVTSCDGESDIIYAIKK